MIRAQDFANSGKMRQPQPRRQAQTAPLNLSSLFLSSKQWPVLTQMILMKIADDCKQL